MSWLSRQCGILNISQPYRSPGRVTGIALLAYFTYIYICIWIWEIINWLPFKHFNPWQMSVVWILIVTDVIIFCISILVRQSRMWLTRVLMYSTLEFEQKTCFEITFIFAGRNWTNFVHIISKFTFQSMTPEKLVSALVFCPQYIMNFIWFSE
jgi:hypothetical protein